MYVYIVNGFIILFHIYDTYVCIHSKCFYYFVSHIRYICVYIENVFIILFNILYICMYT